MNPSIEGPLLVRNLIEPADSSMWSRSQQNRAGRYNNIKAV
jgi:hypothetical protein